jgi:hypothetical protein
LKKKYKILLIILLLLYPIYKGVREIFWVGHSSYTIDNTIKIKLRIDGGILGFQDFDNDKTITIFNSGTKAKIKTSYVSSESNLYFFIDTINARKVLSIVDQFAGQNIYDYSSLKLINKKDCFKDFGGCGGCNDSCLAKLGTPYLTYDNIGFHK